MKDLLPAELLELENEKAIIEANESANAQIDFKGMFAKKEVEVVDNRKSDEHLKNKSWGMMKILKQ